MKVAIAMVLAAASFQEPPKLTTGTGKKVAVTSSAITFVVW